MNSVFNVVISYPDIFSILLEYDTSWKDSAPIVKEIRNGEETKILNDFAIAENIRNVKCLQLVQSFCKDNNIKIEEEIHEIYWEIIVKIFAGIIKNYNDDYFMENNLLPKHKV